MPDVADRRWSADEVRALPEDGRKHECIDGVHLVTPAPSHDHQFVAVAFWRRLDAFVAPFARTQAFVVEFDLELEPDSMVQPDVFVSTPKDGLKRARTRHEWGTIHLAIEVLSPSTARYDRGLKRSFYLRAGVREYWIVDLEARLVERWRVGDARPEVAHDRLLWHPPFAAEALSIDLPSLFAAELDD